MNRGNCPDSVALDAVLRQRRHTPFGGECDDTGPAVDRRQIRQVHEAIDAQETRGPRKPRQSPLTTVTTSVQSPTAGQDMR